MYVKLWNLTQYLDGKQVPEIKKLIAAAEKEGKTSFEIYDSDGDKYIVCLALYRKDAITSIYPSKHVGIIHVECSGVGAISLLADSIEHALYIINSSEHNIMRSYK